jgi:hypothetical protein
MFKKYLKKTTQKKKNPSTAEGFPMGNTVAVPFIILMIKRNSHLSSLLNRASLSPVVSALSLSQQNPEIKP